MKLEVPLPLGASHILVAFLAYLIANYNTEIRSEAPSMDLKNSEFIFPAKGHYSLQESEIYLVHFMSRNKNCRILSYPLKLEIIEGKNFIRGDLNIHSHEKVMRKWFENQKEMKFMNLSNKNRIPICQKEVEIGYGVKL